MLDKVTHVKMAFPCLFHHDKWLTHVSGLRYLQARLGVSKVPPWLKSHVYQVGYSSKTVGPIKPGTGEERNQEACQPGGINAKSATLIKFNFFLCQFSKHPWAFQITCVTEDYFPSQVIQQTSFFFVFLSHLNALNCINDPSFLQEGWGNLRPLSFIRRGNSRTHQQQQPRAQPDLFD